MYKNCNEEQFRDTGASMPEPIESLAQGILRIKQSKTTSLNGRSEQQNSTTMILQTCGKQRNPCWDCCPLGPYPALQSGKLCDQP